MGRSVAPRIGNSARSRHAIFAAKTVGLAPRMPVPPEEELYLNPVCRLALRQDGLIVFTRLGGALDVELDLERMIDEVSRLVAETAPRAKGFVLDTRRGSGKQSPRFEALAGGFNRDVAKLFGCVAWVVGTAVGVLQAQRYARVLGIELRAFRSIEDAAAWLHEHGTCLD